MENLIVASYNLSAAACKRHPDKVYAEILSIMEEADVLLVQEAGEGQKILDRVERKGLHVFRGFGKAGQASTPIITRDEPVDTKSVPLTPATNVGEPGAGGNVMKAKWLNLVKLNKYGRDMWFGSLHTTPSIYIKVRRDLAERQLQVSGTATAYLRGLRFIGGDLNSEPRHAIRRLLYTTVLTSTQIDLGIKDTMGGRSIDDIAYTKGRAARAVSHYTKEGVSDHRMYFVKYDIKPTGKWSRDNDVVESSMNTFKHIHSSSRFDRSLESLEKSLRAHMADAPLVTLTEIGAEAREQVLRKVGRELKWGVITGDESGADDCAIVYDKARFELIYTEQFKSATQEIWRTDGVKRGLPYSTIAVLRDKKAGKTFVLSVGHYASSVEQELHAGDTTYRRAIQWRQSTKNTKNRVNQLARKHKAHARMVVADWNVDFKKLWVRAMVKAIAPSYTLTWTNVNVAGGTHHRRLIDATILRGKLKVKGSAKLYADDASSDHRPYVETLVWS